MEKKLLLINSTETTICLHTESTKPPELFEQLDFIERTTLDYQKRVQGIRELLLASHATGDYIKLLSEYSFCPALIGNDNEPVFLYRFIEVIDEILDYDEIKKELPTLSFSQINSAISFLRKFVQFNARKIDIDELEDSEMIQNRRLMDKVMQAFADKETSRVLNLCE